MYSRLGKRILDSLLSFIGLVVLSPVFLILALLVRIKLGKPVIFKQDRPGKDGRIFRLYKFRTMTDKKDINGGLLPDAGRLTPFGKALRATSLDELPELWNVLKCDMSLVGPRPLLVQYLPLYNEEQARRHNVRPGITGHAQINGRNAISWQDKFKLDCWYVDNVSFGLDLKILFGTVAKVFKRSGVSSATSATMEAFTGNVEKDGFQVMKKDIVLIGAGGFGREVLWQLKEIDKQEKQYNILGFVDDRLADNLSNYTIDGLPVLGDNQWLVNYPKKICAVICIGNARKRKEVYEKVNTNSNIVFPAIISKDVKCSDSVSFGQGCIICLSNVMTVNITIGDFVIVNLDCTVGHDSVLEDFVTLYPSVNVSGNVHIGSCSEIGTGANIIQGMDIGDNSIIGAGSVVVKKIPSNCTAVGVPAVPIKKHEPIGE